MRCEACGVQPARRFVCFYQNIGLLLFRLQSSVRGDFCSACIHKHFWTVNLVNLVCGWWGILSFFITPIFILGNLLYYLGLLGDASPQGEERSITVSRQPLADDSNACYLCGKPLALEERGSRVCRNCS